MSEAEVAMEAQRQIQSLYRNLYEAERLAGELQRQLDSARALVTTLEAETAACPDQGHHRGYWHDHLEDL